MGCLETDRSWVIQQIEGRQTAYTNILLEKGGEGGFRVGLQTQIPPLLPSFPQVRLDSPLRQKRHVISLQKIHMTDIWLWWGEEKTVWSPEQPCSRTTAH